MPQKAGVLGLAATMIVAAAVAAEAGQARGQLVVSAYVMVTASIATALTSNPLDPQSINGTGFGTRTIAAPQTAAATSSAPALIPVSNKPTICAAVAVSCSGDAPMRLNVDGQAESAVGGERCGPSNRATRQSFGLCGTPAPQSNFFAVTIEY